MKQKSALMVSVMAALLIVGAVLMLTSQPTQAAAGIDAPARAATASTVLLAEDFDYGLVTGNLTTTSGGNWVAHANIGVGPVQYVATSLSMPGYGSSGVGGAATISTANTEDVNRSFVAQSSGTVYYAALVNVSAAGTGDYFLHLKDGGTSNFRSRVYAQNSAGVLRFGFATTSTGVYSTAAFSYSTTYLVVTKFNVETGAAALYVLDSFSASEPSSALISFTTGTSLTVSSIAIRQGGTGLRPAVTIDGIRVAKTWEDVVGVAAAPEADLVIDKSGPATATASQTITYTLSLSNTGTATATGTIVTDTLPTGVNFVTYTTALPVNSFTQNGQDLIWDLGDVPTTTVNATIGVEVFISPLLGNGASFTNTVTASTTYTEPNQANNTDSVTTYIGAPDMSIVKAGPASVNAGDTFTYTLAYTNSGTTDALGVILTDTLPAALGFGGDSAGGAFVDNSVVWSLHDVPAATGGTIVLTATALYAGDYTNQAVISTSSVENDLSNNTAQITTTVLGGEPYVQKQGPTLMFGGEVAVYTITYGNNGNLPADVYLTDYLPVSFTVESNFITDTSGLTPTLNTGGTYGWHNPAVAAGQELSFTVSLTVPLDITSGALVTNTVELTTATVGDDQTNNTASASGRAYQIVPIATARAGVVGQVFGVEGSVTYVPGTYNASGWALQDASGGIGVFYTPTPTVALGDRVRLVATRGANAGETQLGSTVRYFANLGSGPQVTPLPFTTAQVAAGAAEGWLAVVTGTVSGVPATCSGNQQFTINDGSGSTTIFVDVDTTINVCNLGIVSGDRVVFTGFGTQFNGLMEIKPRFPADVKRLFDVTFVYNDLEDAVHVGEDVEWRGDINGWAGTIMSHDAGYTVFSLTLTQLTTGTVAYKYYVPGLNGNSPWDMLNTANRSINILQGVTVKQDYRNVAIGWANLDSPATAVVNLGQTTPNISGRIWINNVTDLDANAGRGIAAQLGYGTAADPASWAWSQMTFITRTGNDSKFEGFFTPAASGVYSYAVRYDPNGGAGNPNAGWTYADLNGVPFSLDQAGVLTVTVPQLAFAKSIDKSASEMQLGDVVTYTLDLNNSGDGAANGVLITDVLPVEVTFGGFVQQNGAAYADGTVTWGGTLDANLTATVIFTATVGNQRAFYGRTVTNTAQFTSSNGGSDSAEAVFQIVKRYFIFAPIVRR